MRIVSVCLAMAILLLSACGLTQGQPERFIEPGQSRSSPSGQFLATVDVVRVDGRSDKFHVLIEDQGGRG
jgi:hypothetical protein